MVRACSGVLIALALCLVLIAKFTFVRLSTEAVEISRRYGSLVFVTPPACLNCSAVLGFQIWVQGRSVSAVMTFTLNVPDARCQRLKRVVEALSNWATNESLLELSFVGIGEGRPDLAESHAEILAEHLRNAS